MHSLLGCAYYGESAGIVALGISGFHSTPPPHTHALCGGVGQVMSGYKFRVKLFPGTLKKGKAVRQAAELMVTTKTGGGGGGGGDVSQRERDLIRCASVCMRGGGAPALPVFGWGLQMCVHDTAVRRPLPLQGGARARGHHLPLRYREDPECGAAEDGAGGSGKGQGQEVTPWTEAALPTRSCDQRQGYVGLATPPAAPRGLFPQPRAVFCTHRML